MNLSQKCQYAVRAILELSKRYGQGPVTAGQIAATQSIPRRFLEVILNELKPTGLIESRRGVRGGYLLAQRPSSITVGQVVRLVDGPIQPVRCVAEPDRSSCPLKGRCTLIELWGEVRQSIEEVYDGANFRDLANRENQLARKVPIDFCI